LLGLAIGISITFWPQISSGLKVGLGHPNDPRLVEYLLEHALTCLRDSAAPWTCAQSPPFFHPQADVAYRTETFWGLLPLYALVRTLVEDTQVAYLGLVMVLASANFGAAWLFARAGLGFSVLAASSAAFLFAFAGPRVGLLHQSFSFAQFPWLLALLAICYELRQGGEGRGRHRYIFLFALAVVWQAYAYLYTFYFGFLFLALALVLVLAQAPARRLLVRSLRARWSIWLAALGLAAVLISPLAGKYVSQLDRSSGPSWSWTEQRLPRPLAWLNSGKRAVLWSEAHRWPGVGEARDPQWQALGLGFATLSVAAVGTWSERRRLWVRILLPAGLLLTFAATNFGDWSAWRLVFATIPAADAFRLVHRVYHIALLPLGLAFGVGLWSIARRSDRGAWVSAMLAAVCVTEQLRSPWSYSLEDRRAVAAAIARSLPAACPAFFYSPIGGPETPLVAQLDAMWAGRLAGTATVNGFSGYQPRHWTLKRNIVRGEADLQRLRVGLSSWMMATGLVETCWIRIEWSRSQPIRVEVERLALESLQP
jgi:hypothetical protein